MLIGRHPSILQSLMLLFSAFRLWELTTKITLRKHTESLSHGLHPILSNTFTLGNSFFQLVISLVLALYSGWLLIAEVKSRFDPNTGGADPKKFSKAVCDLGYSSVLKVYSCSPPICFSD